jgi:broad specificity phosphatase PhoE
LNQCKIFFDELSAYFNEYSKSGALYLLRHADKSKEKGRNLSELGVKQMKEVAEKLSDEILMSPKPVRVMIYTSEIKRTDIFGRFVQRINDARKIGKEDVTVTQQEDPRLYANFGRATKEAGELIAKLDQELGVFRSFLEWVKGENGMYEEFIKKNQFIDPAPETLSRTSDFVSKRYSELFSQNEYVIIIGLSHSWILDIFLYEATKVNDMINVAEYAKIELNSLFYKNKWYDIKKYLKS